MSTSIIIPVYNAENYITDCLASLAAQTVANFEVLCIDDGSTDGSAELVRSLSQKDPRFSLIQQENGGAASARNTGYKRSISKYVSFVDADDEVSPTFLETMLTAAEKDGSDVVVGNKTIVSTSGRVSKKSPVLRAGMVEAMDLKKQGGLLRHIAPHGKLVRRSFLDKHGIFFYEGVTYEDYIYWLNVITKNPQITRVPDFVYTYKRRSTSISSTSQRLNLFHLQSRLVQTRECLRLAEETGSEELEQKVVAAQLGNSVMRHLKAFASTEDRQLQEEAYTFLREGLAPYRNLAYGRLFGWRRLSYKLLFEGNLDDLIKLMRFIDRQIDLATHLTRNKAGTFNLFVARYELISLSTQKKHLFNITDLLR